jgi:hypothetical protein
MNKGTKDVLMMTSLAATGYGLWLAWDAHQKASAAAAPIAGTPIDGLGLGPGGGWDGWPADFAAAMVDRYGAAVPPTGDPRGVSGSHPFWRWYWRHNDYNNHQRRGRGGRGGQGPTSPYTSTFDPWSGIGRGAYPYAAPYSYYGGTPYDTYNPRGFSPSAVDLEQPNTLAYESALIDAGYSG